jgi:hypothetical protein
MEIMVVIMHHRVLCRQYRRGRGEARGRLRFLAGLASALRWRFRA